MSLRESLGFEGTINFLITEPNILCGQDPISHHHISNSANPKVTMQQCEIETILIPRNQINTTLDLPAKWLSW